MNGELNRPPGTRPIVPALNPIPQLFESNSRLRVKDVLLAPLRLGWPVVGILLLIGGSAAAMVWLDANVGRLVERNAFEALFLAAEACTEHGPEFKVAQANFHETLSEYLNQMNKRPLGFVLRQSYPELDPAAQLKEAEVALAKPTESEDDARETISVAAKILNRYALTSHNFASNYFTASGTKASVNTYPLPPSEINDLKRYFTRFETTKNNFIRNKSDATATAACMESRLASTAVVRLWPEYRINRDRSDFRQFTNSLMLLQREMKSFADELQDGPIPTRIRSYAENVVRRYETIESLDANKLDGARKKLNSAACGKSP